MDKSIKNHFVPTLRFPEFDQLWKISALKEVSNIYDGTHQTPSYVSRGVKFVSVENIHDLKATDKHISRADFEKDFKNKPQKGDILMTRITAGTIGATAVVEDDEPLGYYVSLALIRPNESVDSGYLSYFINSDYFKRELHKRIIHVAFPKKINLGDIGKCLVQLPSCDEQRKISHFLKEVDALIDNLEKQKHALEIYKDAMVQKLFGRFVRFKNEKKSDFESWKKYKLQEILIESTEKSSVNNEYPVISSTTKGLYFQSEYFKKNISSQDNSGYKILKKGQLVLSPQNLWMGNINLNTEIDIGIVSPSYKIYSLNNELVIPEYFNYLIRLPRMLYEYVAASEQGASIVRRNLNIDLFNSIEVELPSLGEQQKIADYLGMLGQVVNTKSNEIDKVSIWKKGLMQKLFIQP